MRTSRILRTTGAAALCLGLVACTDDPGRPAASGGDDPTFVGVRAAPVALQAGRDCEAVLRDFQAFAATVLDDRRLGPMVDATEDAAVAVEAEAAPMAAAEPSADRAAGGTSDTNTQEEGIDEPDVVETDGDFVYVVDRDALVILDAADATVLSRTSLGVHGAQLLLQDDRLLAVSGGGYGIADDVGAPAVSEPPRFHAGTVIQLVDVADRSAPTVVQTTEVEGHHVSTRVVDGAARVVVTGHPQPQPVMETSPRAGSRALEAALAETSIEDWLPSFRVTADPAGAATTVEGELVECEDVFVPEVNAGVAETSILRVDFAEGFDPAHTTTVVAETGTVYASASTLYLAANRYVGADGRDDVEDDAWSTALHAFDLRGDGAAAHVGAGSVPGQILNQYSLSEHDGHLRVATTEGSPWNEARPSESGVRVLRLEAGELVEVGAVTGLGVTETIHSVRFMGPVGYVVTFRQTDPLYVIDLSDPTAPEAVGELKIPGFSSYLHPAGEGRLIGIGRDADLQGRDQGLLVSLFDVSDPTDPVQRQTYTERDAWSAAGHDPKAFLWWAPESALAIPIERYAVFGGSTEVGPEPGSDRAAAPEGHQLGVAVLDISDDGITHRATVVAPDARHPMRALVVRGALWSLFDGGVVVSDFARPTAGSFTPFR